MERIHGIISPVEASRQGRAFKWWQALSIAALALVLAWLAWKVYLIFALPGIEARELANVTAIRQLRDHSFNSLDTYPENIYLYGALQAWLLSWLPEWNDILTNRLYALSCMLCSVVPLLSAAKRLAHMAKLRLEREVTALFAGCYFLPFLIELPFTLGTPNFMGLLLANCILWLGLQRFRGRHVLAGLLLVGCFLTKQYFILAALYVVLYNFLRCPWKKAVWNIILTGAVALGGCTLCFLSDQVYYSFVHHIVDENCAKKRAVRKFGIYALYVLPMVLPAAIVVGEIMCCQWRAGWRSITAALRQSRRARVFLCLTVNVLAVSLVLVKIGGHGGALGQLYFTQLLTPPLLLLCFLLLLLCNSISGRVGTALLLGCCTVWHAVLSQHDECTAIQTQRAALSMYAADLKSGTSVRGSCMTAFYDASVGLPITENGQQQYMDTLWQPGKGVDWARQRLLPYLGKNRMALMELLNGIRSGRWRVVYTDACTYMPESAQRELKSHYNRTTSRPFVFPGFKSNLERWELRTPPSSPLPHANRR